jgi:RHS repeat-associated protein
MLVPNRHKAGDDYRYGFNGMEKDDEVKGEGNSYDYGARLFDPRIARWFSTDALESKYPYLSTYSYAANNPILNVDFDGNDWGYSTFQKNGKTYIRIIFIGAVLKTSGKDINMKKFIANQKKEFEKTFGQGNVVTAFHVREIKDINELKSNEHLVEIADPKKHEGLKKANEKNKGEGYTGGYARKGGKYVVISHDAVNSDGSLSDKKTVIHELGHTAGLEHPFEFKKDLSKDFFVNGDKFILDKQVFENPYYNFELESNLMNYTGEAVKRKPGGVIMDNDVLQRYFEGNVGKATQGQLQTIINNIFYGHLNSDKDLPAKRKPVKTLKN